MAEEQLQPASQGPAEGKENQVITHKKKKTSWLRTILWMISMMLLVNIVMAIIGYILIRNKII